METKLNPDGLALFVKRACPTCTLIEQQIRQVARARPDLQVVVQDDPRFPAGVANIVDDTALDHSYVHRIEAVPTLIRFSGGREAERVVGWDRAAWRRLSGIADLGEELPVFRPG
ncbi:MAG: thioredoxin family protein [Burkholderiales bacterium]